MTARLLYPALLVALLFAYSAQTTQWETVSESGFTVRMPGKPSKRTQSMDTAVGKIQLTTLAAEKGGEAFIVGYNDFPDSPAVRDRDPEELLNNARDGAVRTVNGKVTSEKAITMNGHPGKEFSGEGISQEADSSGKRQEFTFTERIYWVVPRLYQVLYIRPKTTAAPSDDGQKFLDSFRLTEK